MTEIEKFFYSLLQLNKKVNFNMTKEVLDNSTVSDYNAIARCRK